jgi:hypothetical protein
MDATKIKDVIQLYFNAKYDGAKMVDVFHPSAHIYGHKEDGTLNIRDRDEFIKLVSSHPASKPTPTQQDEILSIDFIGENAAVARVKLQVMDMIYTDALSLLCFNGEWRVVAKISSGMAAVL